MNKQLITFLLLATLALVGQSKAAPTNEEELNFSQLSSDEAETALLSGKKQTMGHVCIAYRDYVVNFIKSKDKSLAKKLFGAIFRHEDSFKQRMMTKLDLAQKKTYEDMCGAINYMKLHFRDMAKAEVWLEPTDCLTGGRMQSLDTTCLKKVDYSVIMKTLTPWV